MRLINADAIVYTHAIVRSIDDGHNWNELCVTKDEIDDMPSAEPERKMGRWERHNTYHGDDVSGFIDPDWRCSKCGEQANINAWYMYDLTDFCPNCGADMRGE